MLFTRNTRPYVRSLVLSIVESLQNAGYIQSEGPVLVEPVSDLQEADLQEAGDLMLTVLGSDPVNLLGGRYSPAELAQVYRQNPLDWSQSFGGENVAVVAGRHRTLAVCLLKALGHTPEVPVQYAASKHASLQENASKMNLARIKASDIVNYCLPLVEGGLEVTESWLMKQGIKRGTAQKVNSVVELVTEHGVAKEVALSMDKEAARKAGQALSERDSSGQPLHTMEEVIETYSKESPTTPLTKKDLAILAKEAGVTVVGDMLKGILDNSLLTARKAMEVLMAFEADWQKAAAGGEQKPTPKV
jgi:hypothetical protein